MVSTVPFAVGIRRQQFSQSQALKWDPKKHVPGLDLQAVIDFQPCILKKSGNVLKKKNPPTSSRRRSAKREKTQNTEITCFTPQRFIF